jgi:hypothetical protein
MATNDNSKDRGHSPFGPIEVVGDPRTTRYTSWLVIRYAPGDIGERPVPPEIAFWESPDVWVESSHGINQPVPGQGNEVFARVTNYGFRQANGVVVKFWWANPSVAITESTANLIGIGFADIPALRSAIVKCPDPWVPIVENGGHECLLAEAYLPATDPLTAPMDPVADRHVGQKNEQLVLVESGQMFHFGLTALNGSALAQRATVELRPVLTDTVPALISTRFRDGREIMAPSLAQVPLSLDVDRSRRMFVSPSALFARRLLESASPLATMICVEPAAPPQISRTFDLEPWETTRVELAGVVPPDARAGQTYMFRIVQRLGPLVIGGYTVALLVVNA